MKPSVPKLAGLSLLGFTVGNFIPAVIKNSGYGTAADRSGSQAVALIVFCLLLWWSDRRAKRRENDKSPAP
jgi:hypothetical protein